jgi:hypothetical protein
MPRALLGGGLGGQGEDPPPVTGGRCNMARATMRRPATPRTARTQRPWPKVVPLRPHVEVEPVDRGEAGPGVAFGPPLGGDDRSPWSVRLPLHQEWQRPGMRRPRRPGAQGRGAGPEGRG